MFKTNQQKNLHVETLKENRELNIICKICKDDFFTTRGLREHLKTVHSTEIKICDVRGKKLLRAYSLKKHLIIHDAQLREKRNVFKCELCKKKFDTPINFANHKVIHSKERPYKCDICDII
jgi:KRAB domain-containing zinc finger protein